jgi:hypothetical protein
MPGGNRDAKGQGERFGNNLAGGTGYGMMRFWMANRVLVA